MSGFHRLALGLVLILGSGCKLCPGAMYVKQGMTESSARSDATDCVYYARDQFSAFERKMYRKSDIAREERRLTASCLRERGYLSISEEVMGVGPPEKGAERCTSCSESDVGEKLKAD